MNFDTAIERGFLHLEADNLELATLACLRVARHAKDHLNAAIFAKELNNNNTELGRSIFDNGPDLKEDTKRFIYEMACKRWVETHTVDFLDQDRNKNMSERANILSVSVGEIEPELVQWDKVISEMIIPQGMTAFDIAAFTDRNQRSKAEIRLRIKALHVIKSRLKTELTNYLIEIEQQVRTKRLTVSFMENIQSDVNNYFRVNSEDILRKLEKASSLVFSKDAEDASLLLTQVRRVLQAVADQLYPPAKEPVLCSDGVVRDLGKEKYLNRLSEFIRTAVPNSGARDILSAELNYLDAFIKRLNEVASKGVHSTVNSWEAKQGLVGLYFLLFNIIGSR